MICFSKGIKLIVIGGTIRTFWKPISEEKWSAGSPSQILPGRSLVRAAIYHGIVNSLPSQQDNIGIGVDQFQVERIVNPDINTVAKRTVLTRGFPTSEIGVRRHRTGVGDH